MTMSDPLPVRPATRPAISDRSGITDAVRVQILATEHWSLLATRSMTWNEVFSRASMFVTVLSAAVVALALVAQATAFGPTFRIFALLVLPVVLLVGLATLVRLTDANADDFGLVTGMNRLRHAYMELAPELEPYFVTENHDDEFSVMRSYGSSHSLTFGRIIAGTPNLVAAINVVLVGALAALVAQTLGAVDTIATLVGVLAALSAVAAFAGLAYHSISGARRTHVALFPRLQSERAPGAVD